MEPFIPNRDALYLAQVDTEIWYRIPYSLVDAFLHSGARVQEKRPGVAWVVLNDGDMQPFPSAERALP